MVSGSNLISLLLYGDDKFDDTKNRKILITAQKMKFSIKDFFSKCDQFRRKLRI